MQMYLVLSDQGNEKIFQRKSQQLFASEQLFFLFPHIIGWFIIRRQKYVAAFFYNFCQLLDLWFLQCDGIIRKIIEFFRVADKADDDHDGGIFRRAIQRVDSIRPVQDHLIFAESTRVVLRFNIQFPAADKDKLTKRVFVFF